jgi:norsolorinic acid ketoreductase
MKSMPVITVEESVKSALNVIDNSTREKTGGTFMKYDGGNCNW